MENLIIINGSPRGERSNSNEYSKIFKNYWNEPVESYIILDKRHSDVCRKISDYSNILFVFPLYADCLPAILLEFLKELEKHDIKNKPTVHAIINCGFMEPEQNYVAVDILRLFCQNNKFKFGTVLCIGSGEAILKTPFSNLVKRKIRKTAAAIKKNKNLILKVTMPIPKKLYVKASASYWLNLGAKNGIDYEEMSRMEIEDKLNP